MKAWPELLRFLLKEVEQSRIVWSRWDFKTSACQTQCKGV